MSAIIRSADGYVPQFEEDVFLADGAALIGNVRLEAGVTIWYGAILRADAGSIFVGAGSAIQDRCTLRGKSEHPLSIGAGSSIAEGSIIRGARIGDSVFVGPGCVILEGVTIGDSCILAAGTLVPRGTTIPPKSLVRGRPAKVIHQLEGDKLDSGKRSAVEQARLAQLQKDG